VTETKVYENLLAENFPMKIFHLRDSIFLICYRYNGGVLEIRDLEKGELLQTYTIYEQHASADLLEE